MHDPKTIGTVAADTRIECRGIVGLSLSKQKGNSCGFHLFVPAKEENR
jgi:hypothetical protein